MSPELRQDLVNFFKEEFAEKIKEKLMTGHDLDSFKINPLVLTALSSGVFGEQTPLNMARALLYPRVFGTSISTTFGDRMQVMCVRYLGAQASSTPGMDIEFNDKVEPRSIIMQLKAGPNTINSEDVVPIVTKMNNAYRLLQRNGTQSMPTFTMGITYGDISEISGHYRKIASSTVGVQANIPILIGQDFWNRLTGNSTFYAEMIALFVELFEEEDYSELLEADLNRLATEIERKYFTDGKFDSTKV
jgi:hypothetical protein